VAHVASQTSAQDLFPGDLGMTVGGACLACPYIGCSSESISMNTRVAAPDDQPTTSRLAMPVARCVQLAARVARYYRAKADPVELAQRCTGRTDQQRAWAADAFGHRLGGGQSVDLVGATGLVVSVVVGMLLSA
jgi:hypothetical protein